MENRLVRMNLQKNCSATTDFTHPISSKFVKVCLICTEIYGTEVTGENSIRIYVRDGLDQDSRFSLPCTLSTSLYSS
jgi:hypothetical protein